MLWVDVQGLCPISMGEAVFLGYYSSFCRVKGLSLRQALWGPPPAPYWHRAQASLAPLSPQGLPGGAEVCFQSLPSPSSPLFCPRVLGGCWEMPSPRAGRNSVINTSGLKTQRAKKGAVAETHPRGTKKLSKTT